MSLKNLAAAYVLKKNPDDIPLTKVVRNVLVNGAQESLRNLMVTISVLTRSGLQK